MSDQTKQPKQPDDQIPVRDADEVVSPRGGAALPKHQQLTMSQHVFIWSLVLVVGVLFGMGSTVPWLDGSHQQMVGDISESEILRRQNVAKKLQSTLNPNGAYGGEQFDPSMDRYSRRNPYEVWASLIKRARHSASIGLMPSGAALDGIVKEFLNRPLPGSPNRRYAEALTETREGDKALTLEELRHFLAERRAVELLDAQHVVAPAVPQLFGDDMASLFPDYRGGAQADQVVVDQVILEPGRLLPTVADDDVELMATYDKLKPTRFTQPAAVEVSIAYADIKALVAKAEVTDAEVQVWYDAHKQDYVKPAAAVVPPKPEDKKDGETAPKPPEAIKAPEVPVVEYKPLAEVAAGIKEKLAKDKADVEAKRLVKVFDATAEELEQQKDPGAFKAAALKHGLAVREKTSIDQPSRERAGQLDVGDLGTLSENQLHLFNADMGTITRPVLSDGASPTWVVVRVEGKREGGFRELKDPTVMKEVKAIVAAKRGWVEFAKQAEVARAAAELLGPGGLRKWVDSEAGKVWNTKTDSATLGALTQLRAPPAESGGVPGDSRPLVSLAMPARPVVLAEADGQAGDLPRFRLVQVSDYKPAPAPQGDARVQRASQYREFLEGYRSQLYYRELSDRLGRN